MRIVNKNNRQKKKHNLSRPNYGSRFTIYFGSNLFAIQLDVHKKVSIYIGMHYKIM